MAEAKPVKITVELDEGVAMQLAQFCKRSSFSMFHDLTEAHLDDAERTRRAYQMIAGVEAVESELNKAGYTPR
jgi:hypothetical protein